MCLQTVWCCCLPLKVSQSLYCPPKCIFQLVFRSLCLASGANIFYHLCYWLVTCLIIFCFYFISFCLTHFLVFYVRLLYNILQIFIYLFFLWDTSWRYFSFVYVRCCIIVFIMLQMPLFCSDFISFVFTSLCFCFPFVSQFLVVSNYFHLKTCSIYIFLTLAYYLPPSCCTIARALFFILMPAHKSKKNKIKSNEMKRKTLQSNPKCNMLQLEKFKKFTI